MSGIQSLLGQIASPEAQPTQQQATSVALALHRLTDANQPRITLNDLAAATELPIDSVMRVIAQFEKRRLVKIQPWQADRLAPVDWMRSTRDQQLDLMGRTVVEMTAFLPSLLEGQLDYSPAADEEMVASAVSDIEPQDFPGIDELSARIPLPPWRARTAITRYMRGPLDVGMRLRVTLDITFPEMTVADGHDNVHELLAQVVDVIAGNTVVQCKDVRFRESRSIALTE